MAPTDSIKDLTRLRSPKSSRTARHKPSCVGHLIPWFIYRASTNIEFYVPEFEAVDGIRMATELETIADLIEKHPEKDYNTCERLRTMAAEMRQDALPPLLKI
jgi:hypothetical protein